MHTNLKGGKYHFVHSLGKNIFLTKNEYYISLITV
jgi:hypothetical protein